MAASTHPKLLQGEGTRVTIKVILYHSLRLK